MGTSKDSQKIVREPMVEGIFYAANPDELRHTIQSLISESLVPAGNSSLIVSPIGSYEISGSIMASAFKAAAGLTPSRVIIIGSCFHSRGLGICLPDSGIFRTPLADSPVDEAFVESMLDTSTIVERNDLPHLQEHSIEVQLPFIQYLFPGARIVPILVGDASEAAFRALRAGIQVSNSMEIETSLIVVSANLSSVLPQGKAVRQAQYMIDLILDGRGTEILDEAMRGDLSSENAVALAYAASFAQQGELCILARDNSFSIQNDPTGVVEYAAIALS